MKLTTVEAVAKLLLDNDWSKYRLAQKMGVRPIMIDNYLKKGTRMGATTADRFEDTFGIEITDAYRPGKKVKEELNNNDTKT